MPGKAEENLLPMPDKAEAHIQLLPLPYHEQLHGMLVPLLLKHTARFVFSRNPTVVAM